MPTQVGIPFYSNIVQLRNVFGYGTTSRERFTNLKSADRNKNLVMFDGSMVSLKTDCKFI